jgi:ABC-type glycerol-3-phosphate transport system permease component
MDGKKNLTIIFILTLPITLTIFTFVFFNFNQIFNSYLYESIFLFGLLTFFVCLFSFKKLMAEIKYDLVFKKNQEKNIRDVYRYKMMMDPPDWDT